MRAGWKPRFLYLATDGVWFKIGVAVDPAKRKISPVACCPVTGEPRQPRIIKTWRRDGGDALEIENEIKAWGESRRATGYEWFDVSEEFILAKIGREIWERDERPKDWLSRPPAHLCIWNDPRDRVSA